MQSLKRYYIQLLDYDQFLNKEKFLSAQDPFNFNHADPDLNPGSVLYITIMD